MFVNDTYNTFSTPIEKSPNDYDACNDIKDEGRRVYCNKMQYLDNVIEDYVNLFKTYKLWDDTLLIFSTDNGGMPYWSTTENYLAVSYVVSFYLAQITD